MHVHIVQEVVTASLKCTHTIHTLNNATHAVVIWSCPVGGDDVGTNPLRGGPRGGDAECAHLRTKTDSAKELPRRSVR